MKRFLLLFLALCCAVCLRAQEPESTLAPGYTPEQLDELLAPIALYPDPLIALILPAAAVPSDITLASRYFADNGDPALVDSQPWDPSVRALAHYPEVISWMDTNLSWTQAVGDAYLQQPADMMKSVQQLRAQAQAAGSLIDTPQQKVVMQASAITIIPAQPDVIYVPQYDPDVVYVTPVVYAGPVLAFSIGYPVGIWLNYECNWDDYGVWVGVYRPGFVYTRDWRGGRGYEVVGRQWRASPRQLQRANYQRQNFVRPSPNIPHAHPMAGAPNVGRAGSPGYRPSAGGSSRPDATGWNARGNSPRAGAGRASGPGPGARQGEAKPGDAPSPGRGPTPAPEVGRGSTAAGNTGAGQNSNRGASAAPGKPATPAPTGPAPGAPATAGANAAAGKPKVTPAPQSPLFGGYERGTAAADQSNRGAVSRQAAGTAPAARPAPAARAEAPPQASPRPAPAPPAAPPAAPRAAPAAAEPRYSPGPSAEPRAGPGPGPGPGSAPAEAGGRGRGRE